MWTNRSTSDSSGCDGTRVDITQYHSSRVRIPGGVVESFGESGAVDLGIPVDGVLAPQLRGRTSGGNDYRRLSCGCVACRQQLEYRGLKLLEGRSTEEPCATRSDQGGVIPEST